MNRRSFLSVATISALVSLMQRHSFAECVQNYKSGGADVPDSEVQNYKSYTHSPRTPAPAPISKPVVKNGTAPKPPSRPLPVLSPPKQLPKSPCPGGVCPLPRRTIRLGQSWVETRLGYTTPYHLIHVHGFSPEIVAQYTGRLNYLHGSPDAPRNPHSRG